MTIPLEQRFPRPEDFASLDEDFGPLPERREGPCVHSPEDEDEHEHE